MARTYRRDARGRFAGNGSTSATARRGLRAQTGAATQKNQNPSSIYGKAGNRRAITNTISQNRSTRQMDAFTREFARPGRKNTYVKGQRAAPQRISEDNFATKPTKSGTVPRSRAGRSAQRDLRSELKASGQSMASYRSEYRKSRRYVGG